MSSDLRAEYEKELEAMVVYYLKKYKRFLVENTEYNDEVSKSCEFSIDEAAVCLHSH